MISILKPGKQQFNKKDIYGFDIETYGKKNKFIMGSVYSLIENKAYVFWEKDKLKEFFMNRKMSGSIISATFLHFDFLQVFRDDLDKFVVRFANSRLLWAKTKPSGRSIGLNNNMAYMTFLDTMNYAPFSVANWGKLLKISKLMKPPSFGRLPQSIKEKEALEKYNIRDSKISAKAVEFLYKGFEKLGATCRNTLASTSMSLMKNKYLNNIYFRHPVNVLKEQFFGYYGGRCEAFYRGLVENGYYYDINSLYPSVMKDFDYPDPNTLRTTKINSIDKIIQYEGISLVKVASSKLMYPLLPIRYDHKLLFPCGEFTSWQSHIELRKAIQLGYKIIKVYKTYYYKETCQPFKKFVDDLYNLRLKYKEQKNPMEVVTKLLMNSHYGKYGQKFDDKDDLVHEKNVTIDMIKNCRHPERIGNTSFFRLRKNITNPPSFTIPIWALYCTSYARLRLYDYLELYDSFYCDTDSIITLNKLPVSKSLGRMKLECEFKKALIVKPKCYALIKCNGDEVVRFKGVPVKMVFKDFSSLLIRKKITYEKLVKFKESLRRKLDVNEIIEVTKELSFDDNKRQWERSFTQGEFQKSQPRFLNNKLSQNLPEVYRL